MFFRWLHALPRKPETVTRSFAWSVVWRSLLALASLLVAVGLLVAGIPFVLVGGPHLVLQGTLGEEGCVNIAPTDCFRAIADARQALLFTLGGAIATIGLYVSVRRWQIERTADDRAEAQHRNEAVQAERAKLVDAIGLLDSPSESKRTAGISILQDAAGTTSSKNVTMILDVLSSHIGERSRSPALGGERSGGATEVEDEEPLSIVGATLFALESALKIASSRGQFVDLAGLRLLGVVAPGSDWSHATLTSTEFLGGDLTEASFVRAPGLPYVGVTFRRTRLTRTAFTGSSLRDCRFEEGIAGIEGGPSMLEETSFSGSRLASVRFLRCALSGANFASSQLFDVSFSSASLEGVSFDDAEIGSMRLPRCRVGHPSRTDLSVSWYRADVKRLVVWDEMTRRDEEGNEIPILGERCSDDRFLEFSNMPGLEGLVRDGRSRKQSWFTRPVERTDTAAN